MFDSLVARHRRAIEHDSGLPPASLDRSTTIVVTEGDRSGSALAVAYHVGAATLIRADPALEATLTPLAGDTSRTPEQMVAWADEHRWRLHGGGDQRLATPDMLTRPAPPAGVELVTVDRANAEHLDLVTGLIDRCDPDDVDAAEIDVEALDQLIVGIVDDAGRLAAFASARPWLADPGFDDIGVLVSPAHRGKGYGRAAVGELCARSFAAGRVPLYRYDWDRPASRAVSAALGFEVVARLTAIGPATDGE